MDDEEIYWYGIQADFRNASDIKFFESARLRKQYCCLFNMISKARKAREEFFSRLSRF